MNFLIAFLLLATPARITLLHVNDTHSHLDAWGPKDANLDGTLGGLPKAAALIGAEQLADPHAVLIHGGDLFHGDLFFNQSFGVAELELLKPLGLGAMVLGNHEFQFGPAFLMQVLYSAWPNFGAPIAATNLDFSGYPVLQLWAQPSFIEIVNGVHVGFLGITTPDDPLELPYPVVVREDYVQLAAQAAAELRAQGAQVIVCIAHLGMPLSRELAAQVPDLDVIVNGHDHVAIDQPEKIGKTLIVSAGEYYRRVGKLQLDVDGSSVAFAGYQLLSADESTPRAPDAQVAVDALKAGIVAQYGDVYHTPVAWLDEPIAASGRARQQKRDTPIGDLFTDAYRAFTGTDVAIETDGFLDTGLPQRTLVAADVFRSMGYSVPQMVGEELIVRPFKLATFSLTGAQLVQGLEIGIATPGGVFLQVSGMRFEFDSSRPKYQRVLLDSVHVGGRKLDLAKRYTVTANEGVVMFLPEFGIEAEDVTYLPDTAWSVATNYFGALGDVAPASSGRIRDVAARGR